jgi:hypothetical protein
MTRKDYILLAEAFRTTRTLVATDEMLRGIDAVLDAVCISLKRDNDRFNKQHFVSVVKGERDLNSRPAWICPYCEKEHKRNTNACPVLNPSRKALRAQILKKYETSECTCAERSWFGKQHDEQCPLNPRVKAVR